MATSSYRIGRRGFFRTGAALAGSALVVPGIFDALVARGALAAGVSRAKANAGYGPIGPVPDLRDGALRLALPQGFTYRSFGVAGTPMADGHLAPLGHDAMAAFPLPNGNIRIVRNHEDKNGAGAGSLEGPVARKYDPAGGGGTVSLEIDPATRELVHDFISLSGTTGNCAGGRTPWGSWLTCEEALVGPGDGWSHPHGYVFEVPALATGPVAAEPLTAMGRMLHEAAVVDPASGIVYETEDNGPAGFYRYLPNQPGNFAAGGRLQMLAIRSMPNFDTARGQQVARRFLSSGLISRSPIQTSGCRNRSACPDTPTRPWPTRAPYSTRASPREPPPSVGWRALGSTAVGCTSTRPTAAMQGWARCGSTTWRATSLR